MSVNPEPLDAEGRAHRRWLITLAITVLFGGFGAVMAYLSYANSTRPAPSYSGRSRSPSKATTTAPTAAPTTAPTAAPTTAPTAAPTTAPPAVEPAAPAPSDKGKGHKDGG